MEQFRGIANRIQPLSDSVSLTTQSGPQLSVAMGMSLLAMMAEAQAYKHNQALPPGTPDVYLRAWEELVQRFGLTIFKEGLWKALRSMKFFPSPEDIEEECMSISAAASSKIAHDRLKAEEESFKKSGEARTNVAELMRDVLARKGKIEATNKVVQENISECPQCSFPHPTAANMRFWSADEIIAYGNRIKELQSIAAANREQHMRKLAEQVSTPVPSVGDFDEVPQ